MIAAPNGSYPVDTVEKVGNRGPTKIAQLPVKGRLRRLIGSAIDWRGRTLGSRSPGRPSSSISSKRPPAQRNVIDLKELTSSTISRRKPTIVTRVVNSRYGLASGRKDHYWSYDIRPRPHRAARRYRRTESEFRRFAVPGARTGSADGANGLVRSRRFSRCGTAIPSPSPKCRRVRRSWWAACPKTWTQRP